MTATLAGPISQQGVYDIPADLATVRVGDAHLALVDAGDLERVADYQWRLLRGHNGRLYAYATGLVYMHRLVLGTPPGYETDHINGDGLDNRRANLRVASCSQNSANAGKPRRPGGEPTSSTYKGVSWDRSRSRWQAKIEIDGRCHNLGRYDDEAEAARAYDVAAHVAWGEFARLNFPVVAV